LQGTADFARPRTNTSKQAVIDYSEGASSQIVPGSSMGTSTVSQRQIASLHHQLQTERLKRKEMEK